MDQNLETKSECGDLRKTKAKPDSSQNQSQKPKDDLPCKNLPISKDPTTSKSACKSNNLGNILEQPMSGVNSIEVEEPIKRKYSIMSFGDDPKEKYSFNDQLSQSSVDKSKTDMIKKRQNSLNQVHK